MLPSRVDRGLLLSLVGAGGAATKVREEMQRNEKFSLSLNRLIPQIVTKSHAL